MTTYRAGQEIDSYCTKCKLDLTHKIIAVVANKPANVECRTCYGSHKYRAPKSASAAANAAAASTKTPRASKSAVSKASTRGASEDAPPAAPPPHAHIFIYTIAERFAPNTWISHKTFGVGVVIRELALNKIEVRFDSGTKVLVQNTPTAS